jgi:cytochrome c peroxidase
MLRTLAIITLLIAGIIHTPFFPAELSPVPAHELFFAAIGAVQTMTALAMIAQKRRTALRWVGVGAAGTGFLVTLLSMLFDVPFTNTPLPLSAPLLVAWVAEGAAFVLLLGGIEARPRRTPLLGGSLATLALGTLIYGAALMSEPYLPDLSHDVVDQFEVFDQVAMLSATDYDWNLPAGFPLPRVPEDNPMTAAKVELGRYLFYDVRLSGNATMACSTCHEQKLAFSDALAVPTGSTGETHVRNSQTLTNVAYNSTFTWGNPVLTEIERQVVIPMFGEFPVEMGITGREDVVLGRLRDDQLYQLMFETAFPEDEDPITFHNTVQALSSFVRALISGNSPYDQFVYGGDRTALSDSALRGLDLFLSEQFECHHCHGGFNFSLSTVHASTTFPEQPFFNTGLYNVGGTGAYPQGNTGVFEITGEEQDMGRFRPPTLRNVELTAPYMHDGSIETLEEVILFYADGGRVIDEGPNAGDGRTNPHKSGFVPGFDITDQQMEDLLAFLHSLTDEEFITNPAYSDPFVGG